MDLPAIAQLMLEKDIKLVTAESCTAGLIAARLADLPGAGGLLDSAFVVYSAAAKQRSLDVSPQTIERYNLTSEEVAVEMALGALSQSPVALAIANTGVVDDTDPAIPAGTQCFAWVYRPGGAQQGKQDWLIYSLKQRFQGDRKEIREAAAHCALGHIPFVLAGTAGVQDFRGGIELPLKKWPSPAGENE